MNLDSKDGRHKPERVRSERELSELRAKVEKGSYEVRPTDVADAIIRGGGLLGFRLPKSVRPG